MRFRFRELHPGDLAFGLVLRLLVLGLLSLIIAIGVMLAQKASPVFTSGVVQFLTSSKWNPIKETFGALPFIWGTLMTSILAMIVSVPLSLSMAIYLSEIASPGFRRFFIFLVEVMASIPSVVYGLWGIFVLIPWIRETFHIEVGVSIFSAGALLAFMIIPTISSLTFEIFQRVPLTIREAALALGATRWQMIRLAVIQSSRSGIFGSFILGFGRAMGETMAVTMVIGNRNKLSLDLFEPGSTLASVIANEYAEAMSSEHLAALAGIGLALLAVALITHTLARVFFLKKEIRT